MDNLSSHKAPGVAELIEAAGARLMYLPPYSPDFNPIENLWAKVKARLRRTAARTKETLGEAGHRGVRDDHAADCQGFFRHCGYAAV